MTIEVFEVTINGSAISSFESFHHEFKSKFGFFSGYGMNMDAWIDCMRDIHEDTKMSDILLPANTNLLIRVSGTEHLESIFPEALTTLAACTAIVNTYHEKNKKAPILLSFEG